MRATLIVKTDGEKNTDFHLTSLTLFCKRGREGRRGRSRERGRDGRREGVEREGGTEGEWG